MKRQHLGKNSGRWLRSMAEVIKSYKQRIAVAKSIAAQLDHLSFEVSVDYCGGSYIDLNYLSHEHTVEVIKVFGGKWTKEYLEDSVNYVRQEEIAKGVKLRVYSGKPPASCKVVQCGEEYVPGYTRKKFKVVCGDGTQQPDATVDAGVNSEGSEPATQPRNHKGITPVDDSVPHPGWKPEAGDNE